MSLDQNLDQQEDDKLILDSTTESFTVMLIPFCSINFINSILDLQLPHMDLVLCQSVLCPTKQFRDSQRIMIIL